MANHDTALLASRDPSTETAKSKGREDILDVGSNFNRITRSENRRKGNCSTQWRPIDFENCHIESAAQVRNTSLQRKLSLRLRKYLQTNWRLWLSRWTTFWRQCSKTHKPAFDQSNITSLSRWCWTCYAKTFSHTYTKQSFSTQLQRLSGCRRRC